MFQIAAENRNVFWAFFEFFHRMYLFLYPIYFSKIFLLKQRKTIILLDRLNRFIADPHLKFWEKIEDNVEFMLSSASVSYFGHNLLLKISIDSELIFFLKGNSIFYNFYRNREIQIWKFSRPKMRFKLLLKIMMFSEHFSFLFFFEFFIDHISRIFFWKSK